MPEENTTPTHLGLILDGNRRWAKTRGLPTLEGHRQGYENLKTITKAAINRGVQYVSAFVFSTENWNRTPKEVKYLMDLSYKVLTDDVRELHKEGIRVLWLGSPDRVSKKLLRAIADAELLTKNNVRGTLCLCFNYGGQQEIVEAVQALVSESFKANDITTASLADHLYKPEVPAIDLLVRTSGEQRLSGYMLWRAAYAELLFSDRYWPDFSEQDLDNCLTEYAKRTRRFGT